MMNQTSPMTLFPRNSHGESEGLTMPKVFKLVLNLPLVMTNIAMENGPFVVGFSIQNGDFP